MKAIGDALRILYLLVTGHDQTEVYENVTGDKPVANHIPTPGEIVAR